MSRPRPTFEQQSAKIRSLQTHNGQLKRERDAALELAERAVTKAREKGTNVEETQAAVQRARGDARRADARRGAELEPAAAAEAERRQLRIPGTQAEAGAEEAAEHGRERGAASEETEEGRGES